MSASKEAIGRVIRSLRNDRDLSQRQLADLVGYKASSGHVTISSIESGKSLPSVEYKDLIANHLCPEKDGKKQGWGAIEERALHLDKELARNATAPSQATSSIKRMLYGNLHVDIEIGKSELEKRITRLRADHEEKVKDLSESIDDAGTDFVEPAFKLLLKVSGLEAPVADPSSRAPDQSEMERALQLNSEQISHTVVNMLSATVGMGAAGLGLGAAASTITYAAVGALASASTGTAIAGLSGVAATNATLAWLGGGTLAAGGGGMAFGTTVLAGIFAGPALIAVMATLIWKGSKTRDAAKESAKELTEAQAQVDEIEAKLQQTWQWTTAVRTILRGGRREGTLVLQRIKEVIPELAVDTQGSGTAQIVEFSELDPLKQQPIRDCLELILIITTVNALPIWTRLQSNEEAQKELTMKEVSKVDATAWIHQSLITAANGLTMVANRRRAAR